MQSDGGIQESTQKMPTAQPEQKWQAFKATARRLMRGIRGQTMGSSDPSYISQEDRLKIWREIIRMAQLITAAGGGKIAFAYRDLKMS